MTAELYLEIEAHEHGRAVIGRGSDFFGPHARESTVGERVFARALAGRPAQVLGNFGSK